MMDSQEINELYDIFHVNSFEKLISSLDEECINILSKYITNGCSDEVLHDVRLDTCIISPLENNVKDQSKDETYALIFQIGRLSGILESINRESFEKGQDMLAIKRFENNEIPEFDKIIKLIYKSGVYSIDKLAELLNIEVNKMHSILSDMRDLGAISYYTIGVFIASIGLTDMGYRYAKKLDL